MAALSVSTDGTHLLRDGRFFPLIADTAWSTFADASDPDWRTYLATRRAQGFTTVLVSILPIIHDRSERPTSRHPFALDAEGHYDFGKPNAAYVENAREFARIAREQGMTLGLVVLWCNYVAGTWGSRLTPWAVMPATVRRAYVSDIVARFAEFDPIFVISGDDRFDDEGAIAVWSEVLEQVGSEAPGCLTTMHSAPVADLPPVIADSPALSFYAYQSGHAVENQPLCFELAARYLAKPVRRPVVNLEPAYEQLGHWRGHGRFTRPDVRRALWWSVIGGASAGVGYGAHGMWQWHQDGAVSISTDSTLEPLPWQVALTLPGTGDVALLSELVRRHRLERLQPHQDLLGDDASRFRAASSADGALVVVYLPFADEAHVAVDLSDGRITVWDLEQRTPVYPEITVASGRTTVPRTPALSDLLIIAER
jgi:hypothetical protein